MKYLDCIELLKAAVKTVEFIELYGTNACRFALLREQGIEDPNPDYIRDNWMDYIASGFGECYIELKAAIDGKEVEE